ncbi:YraN family protein [Novosphingobium sp. FSY-8]|uniref:UPF0102 protein GTZ99_06910 n=1 Tax=Novosphingobium ovatum TaxID=1908523 RepID=A0ABW9XCT9_9SPHN|nr:YraN family protein [Novosphingobium ovatum]NBC36287.1 YraN family protein [Novosphingobium ovatum]
MSDWRRQADRIAADAHGRRGEGEAAAYLTELGWQIIAQRVKTPRGEVDIVARDGACIVCVEVKWRADPAALADAIDQRRLTRVARAAEIIFAKHGQTNDDIRVDVVLLAPGVAPRHIHNAWMPL